MIGILPTLADGHMSREHASAPTRATGCSASRSSTPAARTSRSTSPGPERLVTTADSIVPEAACTSTQFHVQTSPGPVRGVLERLPGDLRRSSSRSAPTRRTSSARSCGARPGSRCSSRPTDTRSEELKAQGVRPRVWFGERWITSVFDLFEENVRYFPALLPDHRRRGPARGARGRRHARSSPSCGCTTARSTAGTGRSTTSPGGVPHLRVENRVLRRRPDGRRH